MESCQAALDGFREKEDTAQQETEKTHLRMAGLKQRMQFLVQEEQRLHQEQTRLEEEYHQLDESLDVTAEEIVARQETDFPDPADHRGVPAGDPGPGRGHGPAFAGERGEIADSTRAFLQSGKSFLTERSRLDKEVFRI